MMSKCQSTIDMFTDRDTHDKDCRPRPRHTQTASTIIMAPRMDTKPTRKTFRPCTSTNYYTNAQLNGAYHMGGAPPKKTRGQQHRAIPLASSKSGHKETSNIQRKRARALLSVLQPWTYGAGEPDSSVAIPREGACLRRRFSSAAGCRSRACWWPSGSDSGSTASSGVSPACSADDERRRWRSKCGRGGVAPPSPAPDAATGGSIDPVRGAPPPVMPPRAKKFRRGTATRVGETTLVAVEFAGARAAPARVATGAGGGARLLVPVSESERLRWERLRRLRGGPVGGDGSAGASMQPSKTGKGNPPTPLPSGRLAKGASLTPCHGGDSTTAWPAACVSTDPRRGGVVGLLPASRGGERWVTSDAAPAVTLVGGSILCPCGTSNATASANVAGAAIGNAASDTATGRCTPPR